eukprot:804542-Prorocentrum_minimum.AAC.4
MPAATTSAGGVHGLDIGGPQQQLVELCRRRESVSHLQQAALPKQILDAHFGEIRYAFDDRFVLDDPRGSVPHAVKALRHREQSKHVAGGDAGDHPAAGKRSSGVLRHRNHRLHHPGQLLHEVTHLPGQLGHGPFSDGGPERGLRIGREGVEGDQPVVFRAHARLLLVHHPERQPVAVQGAGERRVREHLHDVRSGDLPVAVLVPPGVCLQLRQPAHPRVGPTEHVYGGVDEAAPPAGRDPRLAPAAARHLLMKPPGAAPPRRCRTGGGV